MASPHYVKDKLLPVLQADHPELQVEGLFLRGSRVWEKSKDDPNSETDYDVGLVYTYGEMDRHVTYKVPGMDDTVMRIDVEAYPWETFHEMLSFQVNVNMYEWLTMNPCAYMTTQFAAYAQFMKTRAPKYGLLYKAFKQTTHMYHSLVDLVLRWEFEDPVGPEYARFVRDATLWSHLYLRGLHLMEWWKDPVTGITSTYLSKSKELNPGLIGLHDFIHDMDGDWHKFLPHLNMVAAEIHPWVDRQAYVQLMRDHSYYQDEAINRPGLSTLRYQPLT